MAVIAATIPGWYGKLPSIGDFASRRLPQDFIDIWHNWVQLGMTEGQKASGDRWLDTYLNSPIWRFLISPGICGDSLWTGTMMPSVDKVGRYFPLALVAQIEQKTHNLATITAESGWYDALENLSLKMLDIDMPLEELERGLTSIPFPDCDDTRIRSAQSFLQWWTGGDSAPKLIDLGHHGSVNDIVQSFVWQGLTSRRPAKSLWWTSQDSYLHCFVGLPSPRHFSVLLKKSAVD